MPATPTDNDAGRGILIEMFHAAVTAAAPGPVLQAALERVRPTGTKRVWIIAVGKAAQPMAAAAVQSLRAMGVNPAGGLIVAPKAAVPPHPSLSIAVGDHPVPGRRSFAASTQLADLTGHVTENDEVWILLSGGATSLLAAPEGAIKPEELIELFTLLDNAGVDIKQANIVRKRFSRWGAGRLALALSHALIRYFVMSDVIGDDMGVIGSGPCIADEFTAGEVRAVLQEAGIWEQVPSSMRRYLAMVERDPALETPKPGDRRFGAVERRLIGSNKLALDAAQRSAAGRGLEAQVVSASLSGSASEAGRRISAALITARDAAASRGSRGIAMIWGGETTVTLGALRVGQGGRCQELALSAARELALATGGPGQITLLAAGTDGRDGPTDAAGAIVDGTTWSRVTETGRDPEMDLVLHDSYPALDRAGALLRLGLTGTNVMDLVMGVVLMSR